jgi:hypothetical protein
MMHWKQSLSVEEENGMLVTSMNTDIPADNEITHHSPSPDDVDENGIN